MATLRDIKARITGVKNTQQITKAMKMVAAARLRRAQENMINARPYSRKIEEVLNTLLNIEKNIQHPLFEEREIKRVAIVVVTSDRGLCGAFNMNVIRTAELLLKNEYKEYYDSGNVDIYCVGKKGKDYLSKRYDLKEGYAGIFSDLKFDFAATLINNLRADFEAGKIDKAEVVANEFKSVVQQKTVTKQILPITKIDAADEEPISAAEFIFEPDKVKIINALLPRHLNALFWKMLLESYAAELGARMTAMDMATENAKDLIKSLQITYNKERQASITSEILEIVSGANALTEE